MTELNQQNRNSLYSIALRPFAALSLTFAILVIIYAINAKAILPANYYLDEAIFDNYRHITLPCDPLSGIRDTFICTSNVYKYFGIDQIVAPWLSGLLIALLFFLLPVFGGGKKKPKGGIPLAFLGLTVTWAFVAASFNSGLSKELLALFALGFAAFFAARGRYVLTLMVFIIYAAFIRNYWALLLPGVCSIWIIYGKIGLNKAILASILMAVAISIAYYLLLGVSMESIRQGANEARSAESASEIMAFLPDTSLLLGALNTVLIWLSMVFPFKLLMLGSPQHVVVALLIVVSVIYLYRAGLRLARRGDKIGQFCLSIVVTFLAIQSLFEPDYGSFVRHISDFMPFGLIAMFRSYLSAAQEPINE